MSESGAALAEAGQALGAGYRFVELVGRGAVGEVWTVTDREGNTLAAKVLRTEHAQDPDLVERFVRERSVLVGLQHERIVRIRDMVVEGPRLAIVMDYLAGGSLRDVLLTRGRLRPEAAFEAAADVLEALAAAHAQGVTHRDVKPDNVLLEAAPGGSLGALRVSDFGIAGVVGERIRQTTGLLGTPQYMPPELISRGESGPAGDVYASGVVLYELLAGRSPFAGKGTDFTVAYRHVTAIAPALDLPVDAHAVLDRLLSKDPAARPSAVEAASQLRRAAKNLAGLDVLEPGEEPGAFDEVERPATVVRGASSVHGSGGDEPPASDDGPAAAPAPSVDLGRPENATIVRPLPRPGPPSPRRVAAEETADDAPVWWRTRKALLLAAGAVAVIAALVVGIVLFVVPGKDDESVAAGSEAASASLRDPQLPTGLSVERRARSNPAEGTVELTLTYAAQKAELSGELLEVVPGLDSGTGTGCPPVVWEGATVARNQAAVTGLDAECAWTVSDVSVPAGGTAVVRATVPLPVAGEQGLQSWLDSAAKQTREAVDDPAVAGTAYPVQRLRGVEVRTPSRVVTSSPVEITLLPVWPDGADELNPLYVSPSSGEPSAMLTSVAGGEEGLRFSDACAGAIAVSGDGLTVTALQISPQCTIRASLGNFTDLVSRPFGITSRETRG